jgi:SAM-dependent methyltransferase
MGTGDRVDEAGVYAYDQDWQLERERLAGMEDLWDTGTRALISALGIASGWRCLEVGAGSGSIARWLAAQAGAEGEVLATDISTKHLQGIERPGLEVREHDILSDELPTEHFDLVHARLLVEHLGSQALERMVPPLRPGGWLLVESFDWVNAVIYPEDDFALHAVDCLRRVMLRSGYDPEYGRKLVHVMEDAGLEQVRAEGRVRVYRGGSPGAAFLTLSLEALAPALVDSGELTKEGLHRALATLRDRATVLVSPPMIAAWGLKA